jgi:hypothetical protein
MKILLISPATLCIAQPSWNLIVVTVVKDDVAAENILNWFRGSGHDPWDMAWSSLHDVWASAKHRQAATYVELTEASQAFDFVPFADGAGGDIRPVSPSAMSYGWPHQSSLEQSLGVSPLFAYPYNRRTGRSPFLVAGFFAKPTQPTITSWRRRLMFWKGPHLASVRARLISDGVVLAEHQFDARIVADGTPDTDPTTEAQLRTSPWMVIPTLVIVGILFVIAHAIWSEIPPRIVVTTLDQARALWGDQSFVLVLWAFKEYQDLLGTKIEYEGVHMIPVDVPQSLDGYIADVASEFGFRSIRLWRKDVSGLVGVSSKSIHVICPDMIWRDVVLVAFPAAAAIVLVPGRGEGLAWEREVVATSAELEAKTLNLSALKMEEFKAALTPHFKAVAAHVRAASPARAIQ